MKKALLPLALAACFNANAANSDYFLVVPLIPVASQAATTGSFSLSTPTLSYSNVQLGSSSGSQLTIRNTGSHPQTLGSISISQNPAEFSVVHNCPSVLSTGASCSATVTYSPTADTSTGQLTVAMDPAGTKTVTLRGSSAAVETPTPEPEPTPEPAKTDKLTGATTQDLGSLFVGDSNSATFTLRNDGDGAAALSYGNLPATVTRSGDCGASLAAGAACSVMLNWTPATAGALNETLTISAANSTVDLKLTGVAVAKTYTATASATSLDFGSVNTGSSGTQTVTLTNTGNQPLTLASNVGSGLSAPYSASDDCGTSLAAGASCTATVTYQPTAAGAHNQTLTIDMGAAGNKTIALSGTGQVSQPIEVDTQITSCPDLPIENGLCFIIKNTRSSPIVLVDLTLDVNSGVLASVYRDEGLKLDYFVNDTYFSALDGNNLAAEVNVPTGGSVRMGIEEYYGLFYYLFDTNSPVGVMFSVGVFYADGAYTINMYNH